MTSLTDFLLARITEDEAVARRGGDARALKGNYGTGSWIEFADGSSFPLTEEQLASMPAAHLGALENAARFRPARVLAECEAKRRIVELHYELDAGAPETYPYVADDGRTIWPGCAVCDEGSPKRPHCDTVRTLAAVYGDHPDYREEWKP